MANRCTIATLAMLRLIAKMCSGAILCMITIFLEINHFIGCQIIAIFDRMIGNKYIKIHDQRKKVDKIVYEAGTLGIINVKQTKAQNGQNTNLGFLTSSPDEILISKTKQLLSSNLNSTTELVADDFQAVFPVLPTMNKTRFMAHANKHAFTFQHDENYFGFTVDPTEPNRVWFLARSFQTETNAQSINIETSPAQVLSMAFDANGKCYKFTQGFPAERKQKANNRLTGFLSIFSVLTPGNGSYGKLRAELEGYNKHVAMPQIWEECSIIRNALGLPWK